MIPPGHKIYNNQYAKGKKKNNLSDFGVSLFLSQWEVELMLVLKGRQSSPTHIALPKT